MPATTALFGLITVEKLRERELEEARVIQGAMLPGQPLHTASVLISHEFQPVTEAGGEYLDYFTLSDGKVGLYIGDVSGTGQSPSGVLWLLNRRLHLRGATRLCSTRCFIQRQGGDVHC